MNQTQIAQFILRNGLAAMFLWFGFSQLFDGVNWVGWVPDWIVSIVHLPPAMIVLLNGSFEVVAGILLALGIWVRPIAFLLAAHLAIITLEIGLSAIGVRDFGLTVATLSLAFSYTKENDLRL